MSVQSYARRFGATRVGSELRASVRSYARRFGATRVGSELGASVQSYARRFGARRVGSELRASVQSYARRFRATRVGCNRATRVCTVSLFLIGSFPTCVSFYLRASIRIDARSFARF